MSELKYEFLSHSAEVKFKSYGETLEKTFENAALALSSFIAKGNKIATKKRKIIEIKAKDNKALLYEFLEEMIYLLDAQDFITAKSKISIKEKTLKATLLGDDSKKYKGLDHVKAPTYSEMHIKKLKGKYELQVVVDV